MHADAAPHTARPRGWRFGTGSAGALGVLLVALWGYSSPVLVALAAGTRWLELHNSVTARAIATVAIVASMALGLVIAWARTTATRRAVRLADGRGTITVAELEQALETLWVERPDVIAARAAVENRHRRGIRVIARLAVTADARLQETAAAAAILTEQFADERLGLGLAAAPRFDLRYRELDLRAGRAHDFRAGRARRRTTAGDDAAG